MKPNRAIHILAKSVARPLRSRAPMIFAGAFMVALAACASLDAAFAPPPDQLRAGALSAWAGLKQQEQVSTDPKYTSRINRVAPRIIRAAGENPAEWEVVVFDSDDLNAFALPGGKIGFYTGILDFMENDDQIAAVMGHEVAHVTLDHSMQRAGRSNQLAVFGGLAAVAASQTANPQAWMQIYGIGASVGNALPFSRSHETEADRVGLRYMAAAGYNPHEAVRFWETMARQSNGAPPEFLSTHPSGPTRIRDLEEEIAAMGAAGS